MSGHSDKNWMMDDQMRYHMQNPQEQSPKEGASFFQSNAWTQDYSYPNSSPPEYNFVRAHSVSPNMMQGDCRRGRPQLPYDDNESAETQRKREYARTYRERVSF